MLEKLVNIHNNLMVIQVSGDGAIVLSKCILELRQIIEELDKERRASVSEEKK